MARLELADARKLMQKGRPWTFRLECRDLTTNTNKFWMATGRARHEPVEIHYGRNGNKPTIIVKDWDYVERKAPGKVADGYDYVRTPYIRVRQSTIDNFVSATTAATKAKAAPVPNPATYKQVWDCPAGGVKVYRRDRLIEVVFDTFPATWQGQVYHSFKDTLETLVNTFLGQKSGIKVEWGGNGEVFEILTTNTSVYVMVVEWLRKQIPGPTPALKTPPKMSGPHAKIRQVRPVGDGSWVGLDQFGSKVATLTKDGARKLVLTYDHINVAGL